MKHTDDKIVAVFGDTMSQINNNEYKVPNIDIKPKERMIFFHQSVFLRTDIMKKYHFDTSFKISADNDLFVKLYHDGYRFYKINLIVSVYANGGASSSPSLTFCIDNIRTLSRYGKLYVAKFIFRYISMLAKTYIKLILPSKLSIYIQRRYNAKKSNG